jgi:hypothetical protein
VIAHPFGHLGTDDSLPSEWGLRPVTFALELFSIMRQRKKSNLTAVRLTQIRGAGQSIRKLVDILCQHLGTTTRARPRRLSGLFSADCEKFPGGRHLSPHRGFSITLSAFTDTYCCRRPQCMGRIIEVYSIRTCVFFSTSFHGSFPCIIVCLRRLDMKRVAVLLQQNILAVIRTVTVQLDLV